MVAGEPVLARAVRILSVFEPGRPELGVAEIARASGLHVATASRLVGQLVEQGLLTRTGSGRLRIGMRLWELGQRASPTLTLRAAALPFLGETLLRSVLLGSAAAGEGVSGRADLLIEPEVSRLKMLDFGSFDRAVEIGRAAGEAHLEEIRSLVSGPAPR